MAKDHSEVGGLRRELVVLAAKESVRGGVGTKLNHLTQFLPKPSSMLHLRRQLEVIDIDDEKGLHLFMPKATSPPVISQVCPILATYTLVTIGFQ